ncbi:MAG: sodium:solute symporter, partial [Anaerolineales bacterium]|nr:sodium:solute symporter [Anaerolineales bacterium]
CTAWTFYGSVGRASSTGVGFLPIYLGPTLIAVIWLIVLRKIIRISKVNRITSIADFIGSRYGKSSFLAGLVTLIAVLGIVPYLSLQLKAISTSFNVLADDILITWLPFGGDTAFSFALMLAGFAILFGTRHPDVTEHDSGLVLSIAFESIVKLVAFLAVGFFVTFTLYNGPFELFAQATAEPQIAELLSFDIVGSFSDWAWLIFLSMMAIMFLPRQFQMGVLENVDERHLYKAVWLFPLYLLLINIFVLPIAFAGQLHFPTGDADFYVLTLPLAQGRSWLAILAYIGGLSAATGMVIVSTVTLSTMVSNDLILPSLLNWKSLKLAEREDLTGLLLGVRRIAIIVIVLLAYGYFRLAGGEPLVSIGLISFAAVAQFAPAILGGIYWKRGNRLGAMAGLLIGFFTWAYTLPLPSLVHLGDLPDTFIEQGPFGLTWLKPYALFDISGLQPLTHALMWSLLLNVGCYVVISLATEQRVEEHTQATRFVDVFVRSGQTDDISLWRGTASIGALEALLARFLGRTRANDIVAEWRQDFEAPLNSFESAPTTLIEETERLLAGAIGSASANVMMSSVVAEEPLTFEEVMEMLDETSQVIRYSRQLEVQSRELESTTAALRAANQRLQALDQ